MSCQVRPFLDPETILLWLKLKGWEITEVVDAQAVCKHPVTGLFYIIDKAVKEQINRETDTDDLIVEDSGFKTIQPITQQQL